jgi:hypothetical protein
MIKLLKYIIFINFFLFFWASLVLAQNRQNQVQVQNETVSQIQNQTTSQNLRQEIKVSQETQFTASGSALQQSLQNRKQIFLEKQEQFKLKIQEFKDQNKTQVMEKLTADINNLNKKLVNRLLDRLDRLEKILGKIESRANKKASLGADMTAVNDQISSLKEDINALRNQLNDQLTKTYSPQITEEENLKSDIGKLYQELREDQKKFHNELISIRKKMTDLIQLLISVKVSRQTEATSSAIQ